MDNQKPTRAWKFYNKHKSSWKSTKCTKSVNKINKVNQSNINVRKQNIEQNTSHEAKSNKESNSHLLLQYQQVNVFQIRDKSCLSLFQFLIADQDPLVLVADPTTVMARLWSLAGMRNRSNNFILQATNPDVIRSKSCYLPLIEPLESGNLWAG